MRVKIASLVEDMTLYPRHAVDMQHVAQIALAIEAGAKLPPVIADRKSRRVVDGFHRLRAIARVHGADAEVDVELRDYKTERDIILEAIRMNAHHGRRLDKMDQVRAVVMAESVGASAKLIAAALSIPEAKIEVLRVRVASVASSSSESVPGSSPSVVALKRPTLHLAGGRLTKEQADAHRSMPGTSFALLCSQLVKAMEHGFIDHDDETTRAALEELLEVLKVYLKEAA